MQIEFELPTIADPDENILFAHFDIWIDLSQTIAGFAYGIKGMKVGEDRQIFIHPCLSQCERRLGL